MADRDMQHDSAPEEQSHKPGGTDTMHDAQGAGNGGAVHSPGQTVNQPGLGTSGGSGGQGGGSQGGGGQGNLKGR